MTTFVNRNQSYSFNLTLHNVLCGFPGFTASEVLIKNNSGGNLTIFDNDRKNAEDGFVLLDSESIVLRGVSNTNQVSAQGASITDGTVYARSAYFSNLNQF